MLSKELALLYRQGIPVVPVSITDYISPIFKVYPENILTKIAKILGMLYCWSSRSVAFHWKCYENKQTNSSICNGGAISLWRILNIVSPRLILELGCGFSTLVMAANSNLRKDVNRRAVRIVSVDDAKVWYQCQLDAIEHARLSAVVEVVHAPMIEQSIYGHKVQSYDSMKVRTAMGPDLADLVFVDGPAAVRYGGPGRKGSVLQAISLARKHAWILVHDALRYDEYRLITKLCCDHGSFVRCIGIIPLGQGIAILRKTGD